MKEIILTGLDLGSLAEMANMAAGSVMSHGRDTVVAAISAGRALIAAKEQVPHGQWAAWLGANFDYSQGYASKYMMLAANLERVPNLKDSTSIRQALNLLSNDSDTAEEKQAGVVVVEKQDATQSPGQQSVQADPDPAEPKPSRESSPKPRKESLPAKESFLLGQRLQEDREAIIGMSGDYAEHRKLKEFCDMLTKCIEALRGEK